MLLNPSFLESGRSSANWKNKHKAGVNPLVVMGMSRDNVCLSGVSF